MGLIEDIKAKIDANSDGKISVDDVKDLLPGDADKFVQQLKEKADNNGDGKLSFDDIKSIDLSGVGDIFADVKDKLFGKK